MRKPSRIQFSSLILACALLMAGALQAEPIDLTITDVQGVEHRLADQRGKWVVVNYWATWCPPCLEELPELELFHNTHREHDAVVWGMNSEDLKLEELIGFLQHEAISFPVFQVAPGGNSPFGAVPGIPTTFLISPKGDVVARQVGGVSAEDLETFIQNYKK